MEIVSDRTDWTLYFYGAKAKRFYFSGLYTKNVTILDVFFEKKKCIKHRLNSNVSKVTGVNSSELNVYNIEHTCVGTRKKVLVNSSYTY